jgi:hypothetical protein
MPYLPLYLLDSDIDLLNDWLCKDEEVYFIQQVDKKLWKLTKELKFRKETNLEKYLLWHLPSGQIPIIKDRNPWEGISIESVLKRNVYDHVQNPFEPWPGRPSTATEFPFFEDDEAKSFGLQVYNSSNGNSEIQISGFAWLGNRYSVFGKGAEEATEKWWRRLRTFVKKHSTQIPRGNDPPRKKEVHAFPAALAAIKNGRPCSVW